MLKIFHNLAELSFSQLMAVYNEGNRLNGSDIYPNLPEDHQLRMAESDFYNYLNAVFFRQPDSFYAVWEEAGRYVCALRLEPYKDGFLLCALETDPCCRRMGYASKLLEAVLAYIARRGSGTVYSHVSKRNQASVEVHRKMGFQVILEYAVYSDGSVLQNSFTLSRTYKKSEI